MKHSLVADGKVESFTTIIYYDSTDRPAVVYHDEKVKELVRLRVKTDDLPSDAVGMKIGKDTEPYYTFHYSIEVTYQSGSTKYALLHNGE